MAYGSVWVYDFADGAILRLDAQTGVSHKSIPADGDDTLAVGAGGVWSPGFPLTQVNPLTNDVEHPSFGGYAVADGDGDVSVISSPERTVSRVDGKTYQLKTIKLPRSPEGVAIGGGRVWVIVH